MLAVHQAPRRTAVGIAAGAAALASRQRIAALLLILPRGQQRAEPQRKLTTMTVTHHESPKGTAAAARRANGPTAAAAAATPPVVDLRSDTMTKPCKRLRAAMSGAVVGDDVFGEDPTVSRLEDCVAHLLGKEKGLLVPRCHVVCSAMHCCCCTWCYTSIRSIISYD